MNQCYSIHRVIAERGYFAQAIGYDDILRVRLVKLRNGNHTYPGRPLPALTYHPRIGAWPGASGGQVAPAARFLFVIFLLFQFPAFGYQLEYTDTGHSASRIIQLINLMTGAFAVFMIYGTRGAAVAVQRCWPVLVLIGLPFFSVAWSTYPTGTLRGSTTFLFSCLFSLALAICFPARAGLRFVIRVMTLGCVLSVVWALLLPRVGVHQATDFIQNVHAGLWRGIFTHKQGLGVFAGLTFGLLLFYGSLAFPILIMRVGAIACAGACLWGTQSATGRIVAITMTASLFITHWICGFRPVVRRIVLRALVIALAVALVAFYFGLLSFVPALFGKSSDLTGRSEGWWVVQNSFAHSGRLLLGGGFTSGFAQDMSFGLPIDNAYITKLMEFGYAGCAIIFSVLGWIFVAGMRLLFKTEIKSAALHVFPASLMITLTFLCITETGLMEKNIETTLMILAIHIVLVEREPSSYSRPRAIGERPRDRFTQQPYGSSEWRKERPSA